MGSSTSNLLPFTGAGLRLRMSGQGSGSSNSQSQSSLVLAGLLEGLEGGHNTSLSTSIRDSGQNLAQAFAALPEARRNALRDRLSPALLQEILDLSSESDSVLLFEQMNSLGARLVQSHRSELALALFQTVSQTLEQPFPGRPVTYAALSARARREADAILGRGAIGGRIEHLGRTLAEESSNPVMLASMGMAGLAFSTVRLGVLSRLLASPGEMFLTRGLGARALAATAGFAAEVPAFVFSGRGLNEALGVQQDWSARALGRDLASAGITLSFLKLGGAGANGLLAGNEGRTVFQRVSRVVLPQAAMLGGIMLGHRAEEGLGLRQHVDGATTLVDALSTLVQFHVSGRLLHEAMGPQLAAYQQGLEIQAERLARTPRIHGDRPPLAEVIRGAFGFGRPALAGVGAVEGRGSRSVEIPHVFMMENNGEGDGNNKSPRPARPLDGVPTVIKPLPDPARPEMSPQEADQIGRADTILRAEVQVPADPDEVKVTQVVEPDAEGAGVTVRREPPPGLKPPAIPKEALTLAEEPQGPPEQQTGIYDPVLLKAQRDAVAKAPIDPTNLIPGNRLGRDGRYEVVRRLGGGGMGDVWEVMDREFGRQAVIKIPKAGLFTPEDLRRFDREVKIAANLDDPRYVVPVYDQIELVPGGLRVPVMRYVPGRDLHSILYGVNHENPEMLRDYPAERRLDLFAKLCEAVEAIHEDGIVHRDLKPANVRVASGRSVLLMDFGLAKRQADGTNGHDSDPPNSPRSRLSMPARSIQADNITQVGAWQGTPGYIAPETLFSNPIKNFRSPDIFALGVILYETMTGRHPFATYRDGNPALGEPGRVPQVEEFEYEGVKYQRTMLNPNSPILWSNSELAAKIVPPTFREVMAEQQPDFFYELEAVARKAFHPDPEQRYQTARELRQDVLMAHARAELDQLRKLQGQMIDLRTDMQKAWDSFNPGQRIPDNQWTLMHRPMQRLIHLDEKWNQEIETLVTRLMSGVMKYDVVPEAQAMIAQVSWDRLIAGGDRMEEGIRAMLRDRIRENDISGSTANPMYFKEALDGSVRLEISPRDVNTRQDIGNARIRISRFERERDNEGHELGNFQETLPIFEGSLGDLASFNGLSAGYYHLKLSSEGYRTMDVPLHLTLEDIRQGFVGQGAPFQLSLKMVREDLVLPDMEVVHDGPATLGQDFIHDGPPSSTYSPPQRQVGSKEIPLFAMSRRPITVGDYIPFIQSLLERGKLEEARSYLPRMNRSPQKLGKVLMAETRKLLIKEGLEAAAQHLGNSMSGTVYLWRIKTEGRGKNRRYILEDPTQGRTQAGVKSQGENTEDQDPVYLDQPISSITYHAAEAYAQWRSAQVGRTLRISNSEEYEKVARNGFPWTYPWGYDFDPTFVISRLVFENVGAAFVQSVGHHPWGPQYYRDRSIYGILDVIGNARKYTSSQIEEHTAMLGGGGAGVPYGPFYNASSRNYGMYRSAVVPGIGTFYLVQNSFEPVDPPKRNPSIPVPPAGE